MRAIDADALLEAVKDYPYGYRGMIESTISEQPTIEPERKKGKWIRWYETKEDATGTVYIPHCKCSECNTEYLPHRSQLISFCNVCGADMREKHD